MAATARGRVRRRRLLLVAGVLVVAVALVLGVALRRTPAGAPPAPPAMTVTLATATQQWWPSEVRADGSVFAQHEAVVAAAAAGLSIARLPADVGDTVVQGQVLAELDDRPLRARQAELQATLEQAEASAQQAAQNAQRALRQRSAGALSEQDIQTSVTHARVAQAQVGVARAQLQGNAVALANTRVRAPAAGVLSARLASLGMVPVGGEPLFRLIVDNTLEWRAEVPTAQATRLRVGQRAVLALPDGSQAEGHVRLLAPALDSSRRLQVVHVQLDNAGSARAGMYASGRLLGGQVQAVSVPAEAVVIRDGRPQVFVVQAAGDAAGDTLAAVQRRVQTGRHRGERVEIVQGLAVGESVAVAGAGFLADGDRVRSAVLPAGVAKGGLP
ncbi:efflux RND transporter periplasmic adaptor subunit [Stenotrophomonas sp. 24(2023)]|uniref:efflux RND transporter periplasmic adaptor subunit n=1 Tax=Stenotrophomonas sp. 24(2023) TaxID=3068324 RepID=UPI0027DFFD60|nr:efflux RND transporter periplasmic adaptor subunit [Stenotrophomonas sp. 24(2023)]WMJ69346.1 efflux RND transporter periplasmic adaptor subunit [Stenotrophomonas sp. 24(2023)]